MQAATLRSWLKWLGGGQADLHHVQHSVVSYADLRHRLHVMARH
jgi:hypothetical protein